MKHLCSQEKRRDRKALASEDANEEVFFNSFFTVSVNMTDSSKNEICLTFKRCHGV